MEENKTHSAIKHSFNLDDFWIIDTDYSNDDQVALSFLVKKLNIVAITLCQRSPKVNMHGLKEKVTKDMEKIGMNSISIYIGADRPYIDYVNDLKDDEILDPYNVSKNIFDFSEFISNFDKNQTTDIDPTAFISNIAAVKIVELVKLHGKKLNILAMGPLTNISLAVIIDTTIKNAFNSLFIIGGSIYNFGNSGNSSEYNFRCDPIAAKNVISNYKNINLLSLELDFKLKENNNELLEILNSIKIDGERNFIGNFSNFISHFKITYEKNEDDKDFHHSLFGFTSAIFILKPHLIDAKYVRNLPCDIDIFGRKTRGCIMIQNYEHLKNGKFNDVNLISDFDLNDYLNALKNVLNEIESN